MCVERPFLVLSLGPFCEVCASEGELCSAPWCSSALANKHRDSQIDATPETWAELGKHREVSEEDDESVIR